MLLQLKYERSSWPKKEKGEGLADPYCTPALCLECVLFCHAERGRVPVGVVAAQGQLGENSRAGRRAATDNARSR